MCEEQPLKSILDKTGLDMQVFCREKTSCSTPMVEKTLKIYMMGSFVQSWKYLTSNFVFLGFWLQLKSSYFEELYQ